MLMCKCGHPANKHRMYSTDVYPCDACMCGKLDPLPMAPVPKPEGDRCAGLNCHATSRAFPVDGANARFPQLCRLCYDDLREEEKKDYVLVTLPSTATCKCDHAAKDHNQPPAMTFCKLTFCNCMQYRPKTKGDPGYSP